MQAFEAAARIGSFAGAAVELGVTAAAISQQIRQIEARYAKTLFNRRTNGVELTDAGRELFLSLSGAFADLSEAISQFKTGKSRPRVVISTIASVGELWLLPQIGELADRAGIRIVEDGADPVDFAASGVDIRITYGGVSYQGQATTLFHDQMLPVAAPGLAETMPDGAMGAGDELLIHTNWGQSFSDAPSWSHWHQAMGSPRRPQIGRGLTFDRLAMVAQAARQGLGVALLPETLAGDDLKRGSLVIMGQPAARLPQPYVMIRRPGARQRPAVDVVWRHLQAASKP